MEDEKQINWLGLFIKILIVFVFIIIVIWLVSKIVNNNKLSDTFKDNINNMEDVAISYFKEIELPQEKGKSIKVTLEELIEKAATYKREPIDASELIIGLKDFKPVSDFTYTPTPEDKAPRVEHKGRLVPARNRQKAQNALALSEYKCEVGNHETFIRKSNGLPYTEPHHLIPLQFDELFEKSLDVEANIVSLCSNCHNKIHYGSDIEGMIRNLWNQRKEQIQAAGIGVMKNGVELTIEIILSFYGI